MPYQSLDLNFLTPQQIVTKFCAAKLCFRMSIIDISGYREAVPEVLYIQKLRLILFNYFT
jgi:hypothetical protein